MPDPKKDLQKSVDAVRKMRDAAEQERKRIEQERAKQTPPPKP